MPAKFVIGAFVLMGLCLSACGGRTTNLTPLNNTWDSKLSCSHLYGEYQNHNKRLNELTGERGDKALNNVGLLLVSPLFLDLSKTQKHEAQSIIDRQGRLEEFMVGKNCPEYDSIKSEKLAVDIKAEAKSDNP